MRFWVSTITEGKLKHVPRGYGVLPLRAEGLVTAMVAAVAAAPAPAMIRTAFLWVLSQGAPASQEH